MTATREIKSLTAIRGVAALGIVVYHLSPSFAYGTWLAAATGWFTKYYLFVDMFFVLSGFIMCHVYAARFLKPFGAGDVKDFWLARFARIYPLHLVVLLALVAYLVVSWLLAPPGSDVAVPFTQPGEDVPTFVTSLLLVQAWGFHDKLVWNVPAWSISAEAVAYLAFPLILFAVRDLSSRMKAGLLIAAGAGGLLLLHFLYARAMLAGAGDLTPLRCVAEFTFGCGIYFLGSSPLATRVHSLLQLQLAVVSLLLLHLEAFDGLTILALAALIWTLRDDRGAVAGALSRRVPLFLGEISYSIYMTHFLVIRVFDSIGMTYMDDLRFMYSAEGMHWNVALKIAAVVAVSTLTWAYVEIPARRFVRTWLARRDARVAAAHAAD